MVAKRRNRFLVQIIFITLLIILYYLYILEPAMIKLGEKKQLKELQKEKLSSLKITRQKFVYLKNKYTQMAPQYLTAEKILEILDNLTQDKGLKIVTYTPRQDAEKAYVNMLLRGSFTATVKFLYGLKIISNAEYKFLSMAQINDEVLSRLIIDFNRWQIKPLGSEEKEEQIYIYHEQIRDPFISNELALRKKADKPVQIKSEQVKLPFKLIGIIGNEIQRLALVKYRDKIVLLRETDRLAEDFQVLKIRKEKLVLTYKSVTISLGVGGSEIEN